MRSSEVSRRTKETEISVRLCLDGAGKYEIRTGIGFFDHMLTALAVHGSFDLTVDARGDLEVDGHHTVEDTGIVIGDAFSQALGDRSGIVRYGSSLIPMDEALAACVIDISGRPFLVFDAVFPEAAVGSFDTCLAEEFLRAFAFHAGITLHTRVLYGKNAHHMIEAVFKALAHALGEACGQRPGPALSTKGVLS